MDDSFTKEPTAEEAAQIKAVLDETVTEMKRLRVEMDYSQKRIEDSQKRTEVVMEEIRTMMTNLRKR